ncbi:hypothetical protein IFR04_009690 [Cadophora malorum]|uniref:SnoaL-like domain-containing protein n=1 Tax=Cadophora malorum TaxID=108018 RepID=A0A8H7W6I8_9HELO|nr:hypothetical protein IFR04_009690 [Cadophora malorum]
MTSTTTLRQNIEATTRAFISGFEECSNTGDASLINRFVTADCPRYLTPASIPKAFDLPEGFFFDPATYEAAVAKDIKVLKFKNAVISNLVIDAETRMAAFTSKDEVHVDKTGEWYYAEQAWFLYFTEDGSKVKKVIEFCDKDGLLRMASASA